jgi:hypothetical protein
MEGEWERRGGREERGGGDEKRNGEEMEREGWEEGGMAKGLETRNPQTPW